MPSWPRKEKWLPSSRKTPRPINGIGVKTHLGLKRGSPSHISRSREKPPPSTSLTTVKSITPSPVKLSSSWVSSMDGLNV